MRPKDTSRHKFAGDQVGQAPSRSNDANLEARSQRKDATATEYRKKIAIKAGNVVNDDWA